MTDNMTITVSKRYVAECASLIYREWTRAYDALKAVKAEKDDGSEDWAEFHRSRLNHAIVEEAKWSLLKSEASPLFSKALGV